MSILLFVLSWWRISCGIYIGTILYYTFTCACLLSWWRISCGILIWGTFSLITTLNKIQKMTLENKEILQLDAAVITGLLIFLSISLLPPSSDDPESDPEVRRSGELTRYVDLST